MLHWVAIKPSITVVHFIVLFYLIHTMSRFFNNDV